MNKTNVSQLRKQHGLTQQELADKSYVTIRTVQRLEAGEDVSLSSLSAIANALSVPISGLFDDIEQKEKEQEILDYSQQQVSQLYRRKNESAVLSLILVAIDISVLSFYGYWIGQQPENEQAIFGIIWLLLLFLLIAGALYVYRIIGVERLDKKYPKTVVLVEKKQKETEKIDNIWAFLANYWWVIFPIGVSYLGLSQHSQMLLGNSSTHKSHMS